MVGSRRMGVSRMSLNNRAFASWGVFGKTVTTGSQRADLFSSWGLDMALPNFVAPKGLFLGAEIGYWWRQIFDIMYPFLNNEEG
jgi:hypothetical protein